MPINNQIICENVMMTVSLLGTKRQREGNKTGTHYYRMDISPYLQERKAKQPDVITQDIRAGMS